MFRRLLAAGSCLLFASIITTLFIVAALQIGKYTTLDIYHGPSLYRWLSHLQSSYQYLGKGWLIHLSFFNFFAGSPLLKGRIWEPSPLFATLIPESRVTSSPSCSKIFGFPALEIYPSANNQEPLLLEEL